VSANAAAARGRWAAQTLMVDACRIYRVTAGALNTATGGLGDTELDLYSGPCRVKPVPSMRVGGENVGETLVARQAPIISVPMSVTNVSPGDRIEITSSSDAALTGSRRFLVRLVQAGTHITARRLVCEALS